MTVAAKEMVDVFSSKERSELMARIRCKDTVAEKKVRSALHAAGFRFRLHRKDLPGRPDIAIMRHRIAVFVHGCFWHRHSGCPKAASPKTNQEYWRIKFQKNVMRDERVVSELKSLGWKVLILWECEVLRIGFEEIKERVRREIGSK